VVEALTAARMTGGAGGVEGAMDRKERWILGEKSVSAAIASSVDW
jgi:hypothetical protein